jgi:hypothetical protein
MTPGQADGQRGGTRLKERDLEVQFVDRHSCCSGKDQKGTRLCNASTMLWLLCCHAMLNAVLPLLSLACIAAPLLSRSLTVSVWP